MDYVSIMNKIIMFILSLSADPNLPRKIVDTIVKFVDNFLREVYIPSLKEDILNILQKDNIQVASMLEIDKCFNKYSTLFENVDTEAKRFNIFRKKGLIDFEEFVVGRTFKEKIVDNDTKLVPEYLHGVYISLQKSLKLFLEIPGLFDEIINYMKKLNNESHIITNIIQCNLWKKKYSKSFVDEIVTPLYIFYDDLEVGNVLGSHAGTNKFAAVYATIACLPPHLASKLTSILFCFLVRSEDKKKTNNENVFQKLIEELNFLNAEGILITIDGVTNRVKFQLALVLGDNLGLNGIFGFVECFNANYFCRICKEKSSECSEMCVEDQSKLRTKENYEADVQKADISKSGVKERCVFNKINGFHFAENVTVDMMHDVLEGVAIYIMSFIIYTFILEKKLFTLQDLVTLIENFDFGPIDSSNKPPIAAFKRILNKSNLKMSASEMLCLLRYFGLLIGNLIPKDDEHWELYKYLRQIVDILLSPRIIPSDAKQLKLLIEKQNFLYKKLCGDLQPKFHILVHYPTILLNNGPVVNFSSMRFESNHRLIKSTAQSTSCSKNLLKTVAIKQSLQMCEMINSLKSERAFMLGSIDTSKEQRSYFDDENKNKISKYYNQVDIDGYPCKIGTFVVISMLSNEVVFGQITKIILMEDEIYFNVNVFEEITFDFHVHAYIVENANQSMLIKQNELPKVAPAWSIYKNKTQFVATRYGL